MKFLKYCISFISGGIITQIPFHKTFAPPKFLFTEPEPDHNYMKYVGVVCVSFVWFRYGWGVGDIVYATRNQLKASAQMLSDLVSSNCNRLFKKVGIVENKIEKLRGDHRLLTSLVEGIDLKVSNIEVLSLFSSKGISLLCKSLLAAHVELYGDVPKKEVINKNGMFFGSKYSI
jgi:hypothetical protein